MSGGDGDLKFDEIEPSDLFGDRMLDLQARIDFEEVEIQMGVDQEFDGAGVDVAPGAREPHSGIAHFLAQLESNDGRRRFFDDLLMTALNGALALAEGDDAAVFVGEDLDFDVAGLFQIFFEIEAGITEGVERFGRGVAPCGSKIRIASDQPHAFAAPT